MHGNPSGILFLCMLVETLNTLKFYIIVYLIVRCSGWASSPGRESESHSLLYPQPPILSFVSWVRFYLNHVEKNGP